MPAQLKVTKAMVKKTLLTIDGNTGEGGGQIIRTALALSMLTGTPIHLTNIRAGRSKPGLMRQHLVCVQASQQISDAKVSGAHLGSTEVTFTPNKVAAGNYTFDIGSAGSTSLVLQTVLPALLFGIVDVADIADTNDADTKNADELIASTVTVIGGTHNPLAPTSDFLTLAFAPVLAKLGMQVDIELLKSGYAPVGGGKVKLTVKPYMRQADTPILNLTERYELLSIDLVASHLNLDSDICQRELMAVKDRLVKAGIADALITTKTIKQAGIGEGNSGYALVTHSLSKAASVAKQGYVQVHTEMLSVLGEKRMAAEKVGNRLAGLVKRYVFKTDALVDEYLTDQLLLPLALSGGGAFTARTISEHSRTQAWLIEQFLPVSIEFIAVEDSKTLVKVVNE